MLSLVLLLFFGAILLVMVVSAGWASLTVRKSECWCGGLEEKFDARQICVGADTAVTAPVHHRPQDFASIADVLASHSGP